MQFCGSHVLCTSGHGGLLLDLCHHVTQWLGTPPAARFVMNAESFFPFRFLSWAGRLVEGPAVGIFGLHMDIVQFPIHSLLLITPDI